MLMTVRLDTLVDHLYLIMIKLIMSISSLSMLSVPLTLTLTFTLTRLFWFWIIKLCRHVSSLFLWLFSSLLGILTWRLDILMLITETWLLRFWTHSINKTLINFLWAFLTALFNLLLPQLVINNIILILFQISLSTVTLEPWWVL